MKNLILFIVLLIFNSCSTDSNKSNDAVNIDNGVTIFLKSIEGNNLLNTTNYNSNVFKIYYKINNENIEINNPNNDFPRNYYINNESNPISMKLFLNHSVTEEYPITLIEWNTNDTDTIKTYFRRGIENNTDYEICEKIWLNDVLIWDISTANGLTEREITILK